MVGRMRARMEGLQAESACLKAEMAAQRTMRAYDIRALVSAFSPRGAGPAASPARHGGSDSPTVDTALDSPSTEVWRLRSRRDRRSLLWCTFQRWADRRAMRAELAAERRDLEGEMRSRLAPGAPGRAQVRCAAYADAGPGEAPTLIALLDALVDEAREVERADAREREGKLSALAQALARTLADADAELGVACTAAAEASADFAAERSARTDLEVRGHVALDAISADGEALGTLLRGLTQVHASHVAARAALAESLADSEMGTPGSSARALPSPPRTAPPALPPAAHTRQAMQAGGARAQARILLGRDGGARVAFLYNDAPSASAGYPYDLFSRLGTPPNRPPSTPEHAGAATETGARPGFTMSDRLRLRAAARDFGQRASTPRSGRPTPS